MDLEIPDFVWDQPGERVTLPRRKDEIELGATGDITCDALGVTTPAYKKKGLPADDNGNTTHQNGRPVQPVTVHDLISP